MAASTPRMTRTIQAVLKTLLVDPSENHHSLDIGDTAGLPARVVVPALARLERCGWLESGWDAVDPDDQAGPRRRWYRLSADGALPARQALALAQAGGTVPLRRLRPIGGTT